MVNAAGTLAGKIFFILLVSFFSPLLNVPLALSSVMVLAAASDKGAFPAKMGQKVVSVKSFGALGDGRADDTAAIQKAVDSVYAQGGGVINFPPGTYLVTSVNIREGITYQGYGATIKRPDNLTAKLGQAKAKWLRTFTTTKYPYAGQNDSRPLVIKGLTFDGSSQTQGPYQRYELEQAALVFLNGDKKYPGRLTAVVEDCKFINGVGDGVHAYCNTALQMINCEAVNVFRGGFVLTGGHSLAKVKNLTTKGEIDPTGIDVEVDSKGYGDSFKVEVYLEDLNLIDGDFDVAVKGGSTVIGKNIVAEAPFNLYTPDSTAKFTNCKFGMGPGDRIIFPHQVTFTNCEFYLSGRKSTKTVKMLSAAPFVAWNIHGTFRRNQSLTFNNCKFKLGNLAKEASHIYYGILTGWDAVDFNNVLTVNGGSITGNFDVGIGMMFRGGNWKIKDLAIEAALPFSWTGFKGSLGNSVVDILLDNVKIKSSKYMYICGYHSPTENRLKHVNVTIDEGANHISSTYGLEANSYLGNRIILGTAPPTPATHGILGDIYQLKENPAKRWRCTKAGYVIMDKSGKDAKAVESAWEMVP